MLAQICSFIMSVPETVNIISIVHICVLAKTHFYHVKLSHITLCYFTKSLSMRGYNNICKTQCSRIFCFGGGLLDLCKLNVTVSATSRNLVWEYLPQLNQSLHVLNLKGLSDNKITSQDILKVIHQCLLHTWTSAK